jgi:hypothetical protein
MIQLARFMIQLCLVHCARAVAAVDAVTELNITVPSGLRIKPVNASEFVVTHGGDSNVLRPDDIIVAADGEPISIRTLVEVLQSKPGTKALLPLVGTFDDSTGSPLQGFVRLEIVRPLELTVRARSEARQKELQPHLQNQRKLASLADVKQQAKQKASKARAAAAVGDAKAKADVAKVKAHRARSAARAA